MIEERFRDYLCECDSCKTTFKKVITLVEAIENLNDDEKKLQNNLEGIVNEEEEEIKHEEQKNDGRN